MNYKVYYRNPVEFGISQTEKPVGEYWDDGSPSQEGAGSYMVVKTFREAKRLLVHQARNVVDEAKVVLADCRAFKKSQVV